MNPSLRDRILRHLDPLPDERAYQVLDYIEFLETRYGEAAVPATTLFQRFSEGIEDTLRAGRVSTTAIAETVGLLNRAAQVLGGAAAAGKSVASDIVGAVSRATTSAAGVPATAAPSAPAAPPAPGSPDADATAGATPSGPPTGA
jgi:hypothetical protein